MDDVTSGALVSAPETRRALQLDTLSAILPRKRRDRLADTRDLAMLLLAFASVGRRRSEVARLRVEQLNDVPTVAFNPQDQNPRRCQAWPFSLAAPRPARRMRRGGCCWSGRRSRRCANGSNGPTSEAMQPSQHRSVEKVASRYDNGAERRHGCAVRLRI